MYLAATVTEADLVEACAASHCRVNWRSPHPASPEVTLRVADISLRGACIRVFKNTEIVQTLDDVGSQISPGALKPFGCYRKWVII